MAVAGAGLHALKPLLRLEKSELSSLLGEWGCGCVLGDSTQADGMVGAASLRRWSSSKGAVLPPAGYFEYLWRCFCLSQCLGNPLATSERGPDNAQHTVMCWKVQHYKESICVFLRNFHVSLEMCVRENLFIVTCI